MSSANKGKGYRFEAEVVNYLRGNGFPEAERKIAGATLDRGDISGVPGWTLELKNLQSVAEAVRISIDEGRLESVNAGTKYFAGVVKRRRQPIQESYVVMPLEQFVRLLNGSS